MLEMLLDMFGSARDKEVVNAILGFFTILLSNLTRQPSLNYLLSHGVTSCLTMAKFGNMNNEIADYYINFLKVLSRKITTHNLQLFFNEVPPLLVSATPPFPS
jgi:predicted transcriptional regulator